MLLLVFIAVSTWLVCKYMITPAVYLTLIFGYFIVENVIERIT